MTSTLISKLLATGLYSGLTPKAPGTVGSLAYFLIFLSVNWLTDYQLSAASYYLLALAVSTAGLWAITHQLRVTKFSTKDPQHFVIDEWAGLAIAFCAIANDQNNFILFTFMLLILFRIFDISKPWPIKAFERLPGAWGIMLDDIVAGFAAFFSFKLLVILYSYLIV